MMKTICAVWFLCSLQLAIGWPNVGPTESTEQWTGRWFPERPIFTTPVPAIKTFDRNLRRMGEKNICDNGKTNLHVDNPGDTTNYICMSPRNQIWPDLSLAPVLEYENIPAAFKAEHRCMNESILYDSTIPTFGTHRQLWPIYGEYTFLPTQRWLHTLEHGGIAALYHPCADSRSIAIFKKTVASCLRRHVISPLPTIEKNRAFALVAWGVRLRMSNVDIGAIRQFIQSHALQGPEKLSKDGQFHDLLLKKADIISDFDDSQLCPQPLAHD